jgi:glutathione S-transferase
MLELYHDWRSFCSIKVRLCLVEKGLDWTSHFVDLMKLEHTRPEYLKLNPNGVVPTLVHDGAPIIESTIINEYLEEVFPAVRLAPDDPRERAAMRFWVKYEDDVLHPAIRPATFSMMMAQELAVLSDSDLDALMAKHPNQQRAKELRAAAREPFNEAAVGDAKRRMELALLRLDGQLAKTEWLAGTTYSLADVAAAPFIDRLEELDFVGLWKTLPNVRRWIVVMKARPAYQDAIPNARQRFAAAKLV